MVSTRVSPNANPVTVNIVGSSVFGRFSKISSEKTINCYVTTNGAPEESENFESWLISFPGYQRVLNLFPYPNPYPNPPLYPDQVPVGQGRGMFHSIRGNIAIVVVNSVVYALSPTLGQTTVGSLATSQGEVFIAENLQSQICIVDGVNAYIYNYSQPAPNLTVQTDSGGPLSTKALVPNYVEYHNTFFLFGNAATATNSSFWYAYSYATATTIAVASPTGSFQLLNKADFALAVKRLPGRGSNVLVMGSAVCEVWTFVGGEQAYIRQQSLNINYGCQSVSTIGEGADMLVWLGVNEDESPVIVTYDGNELKRISDDGIDYKLGTLVAPQSSTAILFRQEGHLFYQITFYDKHDNLTLLYDFNTEMFFNLVDPAMNYHPARDYIYFNLKTYFISLRNAALYELSSDIFIQDENLVPTNVGSPYDTNLAYEMQRIRVTSNIRLANSSRFIANSLVITLEQGTDPYYINSGVPNFLITEDAFVPPDDDIITEQGQYIVDEQSSPSSGGSNVVPAGYAPRIDLAFSKDGGVTWSGYVSRTLNPLAYRQNILHWEGMGVANDICFTFRFLGSWRFILQNGQLDVIS